MCGKRFCITTTALSGDQPVSINSDFDSAGDYIFSFPLMHGVDGLLAFIFNDAFEVYIMKEVKLTPCSLENSALYTGTQCFSKF